MKDEMISKKKFQPGDKFILEIGEKRMALDEYEIVGTDLWVWGSLLEKLTPYEPDYIAEVGKKVDADLISRRGAIEALVDWEMTYDWDEHCREEDPKPAYIVSPSDVIKHLPSAQPEVRTQMSSADCISRQTAIKALHDEIVRRRINEDSNDDGALDEFDTEAILKQLPPAQPEIIHCRDCEHWNQATAYHGGALSFGFCESDDMWRSLYGETTEVSHIDTDDDFFCGYAERREE